MRCGSESGGSCGGLCDYGKSRLINWCGFSNMQEQWAIDLGTTNSVVAMAEGGSARLVHLRDITRKLPVDQSPLIPSTVHLSEEHQKFLWLFRRKCLVAYIGQQALGRNFDGRSPAFAQSF